MNFRKNGFTIPELVVVITVLAIVSGISFLSFSGYTKNSRDTVRTSDLNNIKISLEDFYNKSWKYPNTTWPVNITYKWAIAWWQWSFWESTFWNVMWINSIPVDPVTWTEYTYSLLSTKKEFELAAALEWNFILKNDLLDKTYARDYVEWKSLVIWRYNWQVLPISTWSLTYILAIPTIISWDLTLLDLEDIISNKKLAYRWSDVVSWNFVDTIFNTTNTFDFSPDDYVVFEWILDELITDENKRILLLRYLQLAYKWTFIEWKSDYDDISTLDIDLVNPSTKIKQSSCFLLRII